MSDHFTRVGHLTEADHHYTLRFNGVKYKPTNNAAALGTLLFGLRPAGFTFDCQHEPHEFMQVVTATARVLHMAANNIPFDDKGEFTNAYYERLVSLAVGLAPDDTAAADAARLIKENMGPYWPQPN